MSYPVPPLVLASGLLLLVAGWDIARRRIPNWANAALGATGLAAQALLHGGWAVLGGLGAAAVTLVVLWMPWTKGRLGGGDVKARLCAAIWLGIRLAARIRTCCGGAVRGRRARHAQLPGRPRRAVRQDIRANLKLAGHAAGLPDAPIRSGSGPGLGPVRRGRGGAPRCCCSGGAERCDTRRLAGRRDRQRGAAAVEFALVCLLFFTLVIG